MEKWIAGLATITETAIGVAFDPGAEVGERWLVNLGLDWSGVGETPILALRQAMRSAMSESLIPPAD